MRMESPFLSFLISPRRAQRIAAATKLERRSVVVAQIVILLITAFAIGFTAKSLHVQPIEGLLNLGELAAAAGVACILLRKLRPVCANFPETLKRICLAVSSVVVVWVCAATILLALSVVFAFNVGRHEAAAISVEIVLWAGLLLHSVWSVSKVAGMMRESCATSTIRTAG